MSRANVRSVVVTWLRSNPITGLSTILRAAPRDLAQGGISISSGAPGVVSGAIAVVFLRRMDESAKAFDGAGGGRQTNHEVEIQLFHRSLEPDPADAMDDFDRIVDALLDLLRTDPQMGQTGHGPIISIAYERIGVEFGETMQSSNDSGVLNTWATISFPALEWTQVT